MKLTFPDDTEVLHLVFTRKILMMIQKSWKCISH